MAHVRKGQLTAIKEWRKHLRFWKKFFWKMERQEARRQAREEAKARPKSRAFDLRFHRAPYLNTEFYGIRYSPFCTVNCVVYRIPVC